MKMNKNKLKNLNYLCAFCGEIHEVEVYEERAETIIEGTPIQYNEIYYYCRIEDDEFIPAKLLSQNLLAAKDAFRKNNGLLTSKEIKDIRDMYNLTQKEFSNMLGWGDATVQRYEKKSIQDETYDQKIRQVKDNPKLALEELEKHKDKFTEEIFLETQQLILKLIKEKSIKYFKKQVIESQYIEFMEPSDFNGYKNIDLDKVEDIITYLAQFSSRLYKVKLMKLLWYVDVLYYKKFGKSMSGLVYKHLPLGAVPIAHEGILSLCDSSIIIEEEIFDDFIAYKITTNKEINLSKFDPTEIVVLQEVLHKFDSMGSKMISDYMHKEKAYEETKEGEIIPFSLAKEIKNF
jgi:putative zinc finger/helix-turn-helix YgiT family protein